MATYLAAPRATGCLANQLSEQRAGLLLDFGEASDCVRTALGAADSDLARRALQGVLLRPPNQPMFDDREGALHVLEAPTAS